MIGQKVRARRLELGLTQEQLAHKMGYKDKTAINKIELDKNDVNQTKLIKLAKALEVPPTYFVDDVEHQAQPPQRIIEYAKRLSELSPATQENALKYIDFLAERENEQ